MTDLTKLSEAIDLVVADERSESGQADLPEREALISARTLELDDVTGSGAEAPLLEAFKLVLDANMADIDAALAEREAATQ